jgi:hypothetical protein
MANDQIRRAIDRTVRAVKTGKPCAEAYLDRGVIVIRVPVRHLSTALSEGPYGHIARITDAAVFAKGLVYALNEEDEGGTTPVHRLLDQACEKAIEGDFGIELLSPGRKETPEK